MEDLTIPVTPLQQNCTLLWDKETHAAVIVDPGGDLEKIKNAIRENNLRVEKILLTHGHFDHASGAGELSKDLGELPILGPHHDDLFLIEQLPEQCAHYNLPVFKAFSPTTWLNEGDIIAFGSCRLEVFHTPGHTPGHIIFFSRTDKLALVGDVLFKNSVGRTDFTRGNSEQLIASITQKLWPLGDDVTFVPGHRERSTFGHERQTNRFVADHILMPS